MAVIFRVPITSQGSLAITPRPRGGDWLEDDIADLARSGVGVLVSMLREDEQHELGLEGEASACSRSQIEFVPLPVPDLGAPTDGEAFIRAVHGLADRIRNGESIAMHCRQSVGRSGMLAVSIAIALGVPLESALDAVSRVRGVSVPETKEQIDWLRWNAASLSGAVS
jgi:protein-tyrosine phosphatase